VLSGECPHFPLVYHWRVLPRAAPPPLSPEQLARLDRAISYWDDSDAVRARLEAIVAATASIVVFLEYVPETLHAWLAGRLTGGRLDAALEASIVRLHEQMRDTATFMTQRDMLHFDLHSWNVMTDGEQIYAADFGLAVCSDFDLSPAERAFFETHRLYDRCYVDGAVVEWLAPETDPPVLTPALRALVDRCGPVANILHGFFKALREGSKRTPYPAVELEAALAAQSCA
jgi:hypothetical protein